MLLDLPKFSKSSKNINYNLPKYNNINNEKGKNNNKIYRNPSDDDLLTINLNLNLGKNNIGKIREYQIIKELGEGSFGTVYLVQKENTNKNYALKIINKEFIIKQRKTEEPMIEKTILTLCKHPSIIKLISTFQTQQKLFFVLEYAKNKDLKNLLKIMNILPNNIAKQIIAELVNVLEYLHIKMNISHNDLKPGNIMLDKNFHVKLIDFSTAKIYGKIFEKSTGKFVNSENFVSKEIIGTIEYISPEMINHTIEDYRTNDIWALGIIIYYIYNGKTPFQGKNDYLTCENIKKGIFNIINKNIPIEVIDLINNILVVDVQKRYNIQQIKKHKFFEDINWNSLLNNQIQIDQNIIDDIQNENIDNNYDDFFLQIEENLNIIENKNDFQINIYQKNYSDEIIKDFYYIKYNFYSDKNINNNHNNIMKKKNKIIHQGILTKIGFKEKEIRLILYDNYNIDITNVDNNKLIKNMKINKNTLIKIENQTQLIIGKYKFKSSPKEIIKWYYLISDIYFCRDN